MNRNREEFLPARELYCKNNNLFLFLKKFGKLFAFISFFSFAICCVIAWNINNVNATNQSFKDIFLSFFADYSKNTSHYNSSLDPIRRVIWINLASFIAGIALSIASSVAQSLTQNVLADATTLGMVDASIFGIIFMKTFFSMTVGFKNYHWFYLLFSLGASAIVLLCLVCFFNNNKNNFVKIVLFGLVLNIFFKTIVHLLKTYNANAVNAIFALSIGGSENVYHLFSNQFQILKIFFFILLVTFVIAYVLSKQLNLSELGEEQSKSLGINIKYVKILGYLIILITTNIAIVLAGNISFIGLLSVHIIRLIFKTRKYQIIIPLSAIFSAFVMVLSVAGNNLFPQIASSVFILFFGSLTLLYLVQQNKKL